MRPFDPALAQMIIIGIFASVFLLGLFVSIITEFWSRRKQ